MGTFTVSMNLFLHSDTYTTGCVSIDGRKGEKLIKNITKLLHSFAISPSWPMPKFMNAETVLVGSLTPKYKYHSSSMVAKEHKHKPRTIRYNMQHLHPFNF